MTRGADTVKATLTVKNIGPGLKLSNVSAGINNTIKLKSGDTTLSLLFSDRSLNPPTAKGFKDVVAKLDYKMKEITAHTEFDLATKKYLVGATFSPKGATDGMVQTKLTYSNKDNMMLSAKYFYTKDSWCFEPSYSFPKAKFAFAVNKKIEKDTVRMSYDLSNNNAAAEWNHKPFKTTISSVIVPGKQYSKPSLSISAEKVYEF
eukprot:gene1777-33196_t